MLSGVKDSSNTANGVALAIETRGLEKKFGDLRAVDGLDLGVGVGRFYGFLGPNGAGKTTTIRILTGTARSTGGAAFVGGVDVSRDPLGAKRHIGVVSQHLSLDSDLTVREIMELHCILHNMERQKRRKRIAEMLDFADLADRATSLARTLSGGMKRRLTIVRALLHEPRILFLDEPTTGLDAGSRRKIWDLIRSIHRKGVTVFLTTHYIEEAEFLCETVGIIDRGRLIAEGNPAQMVESLGGFAVDLAGAATTDTRCFPTRKAALEYLADESREGTVRRTNLEDLFLYKTGRRVS